jgi:hypothetical protein
MMTIEQRNADIVHYVSAATANKRCHRETRHQRRGSWTAPDRHMAETIVQWNKGSVLIQCLGCDITR